MSMAAARLRSAGAGLDGPPARQVPVRSWDHLLRLSDDTGLFEHACGAIPRRQHGYCVDDVARGLVVLSREAELSPRLVALASTYLAFVAHAQDATGQCRNRLGFDRQWRDTPGVADCWGRAVWGLGSLAGRGGLPWLGAEALQRFELSASRRSPWRRATAFAALGALAVLEAHPDHGGARALLADALPALGGRGEDPSWPWPERRLTYANASIAEALFGAGEALGDERAVADGLGLLAWLFDVQTTAGHLSPVAVGGWSGGEPRPAFDQQPIEVAALADAAARAFALTAEPHWSDCVARCARWFAGDNDCGVAMYDTDTGGGFDGLEWGGRNANQGAESTLAALATLQHAARLQEAASLEETASSLEETASLGGVNC
jgi:hypothetical protein